LTHREKYSIIKIIQKFYSEEILKEIKLLALGDIVRPVSCDYVAKNLWRFRKEHNIDIVIANGENSSETGGIDRTSADTLLSFGVDVITTGNHVFKSFDARKLLDENKFVIRPANYPPELPGYGYTLFSAAGKTFLIINVMGIVLMDPLSDPFSSVEKILEKRERLLSLNAEIAITMPEFCQLLKGRNTSYVFQSFTRGICYSDVHSEKIEDIIETAIGLTSSLKFYHDIGYVHLDVKPENMLPPRTASCSTSCYRTASRLCPAENSATTIKSISPRHGSFRNWLINPPA
jgi:serine/threonine protein kinase